MAELANKKLERSLLLENFLINKFTTIYIKMNSSALLPKGDPESRSETIPNKKTFMMLK